MNNKQITICICNFNTDLLTLSCIKSIHKYITNYDYKIIVVDNSTENIINFKDNKDITYIDNRTQSLFKYRDDLPILNSADYKHSQNIQYVMDIADTDDLLILDSDSFIKKDIDFIDQNYITIAELENEKQYQRFTPYIEYFNLKMMRQLNIKYLDIDQIMNDIDSIRIHLIPDHPRPRIYTGVIFSNTVLNSGIPYKVISNDTYINHLIHGNSIERHCLHNNFISMNESQYL